MTKFEKVTVATCSECNLEFRIEFDLQEAIVDHLQMAHGLDSTWLEDVAIEEIEPTNK